MNLSSSSALARPRLLVEEYTWPEKKTRALGRNQEDISYAKLFAEIRG